MEGQVARLRELRHEMLNRDPRLRGVLAHPAMHRRAVNVHDIIQQVVDMPRPASRRVARMHVEGDILSYTESGVGRVGLFLGGAPLRPDLNYFEIEIRDVGMRNDIVIGLTPKLYSMERLPGWAGDSIGLHSQTGNLHKASSRGRAFASTFEVGDKMGCGIKFEQVREDMEHVVPVFFTKNGREIGTVFVPMPQNGFYPAVGMRNENEEVRLSLDLQWGSHDDVSMCIDNVEDEWARLHDIRLNGQLLEYTGRGKSIADVGLAQAKRPLSTQNHYFELEITDQGDNCYIAIGVARKDYPSQRHPGWNKGSVAYHADDGKIFIGSGTGDPFGPKCSKGDIMGCGILFPRDYQRNPSSSGGGGAGSSSNGACAVVPPGDDSDGTRDDSDNSDHEYDEPDYVENVYALSGDSDDDDDIVEQGAKIKVFFTRNGKMVGHREVVMPASGFYPTVGMLSSDEKVRVDLHPLTG